LAGSGRPRLRDQPDVLGPIPGTGYSTSGARSDADDAHVLAEIVRLDRAHHREVAGDADLAEAAKLLARAHQNLIWERVRPRAAARIGAAGLLSRAAKAFLDLTATDALGLDHAPDPAHAAKLTRRQVVSALTAAHRHHIQDKAEPLQLLLRQPGLRQPAAVEVAYAAIVIGQVKIFNEQANPCDSGGDVKKSLSSPGVQIYRSQPGLGPVLAALVLGGFGDDPTAVNRTGIALSQRDTRSRAAAERPGFGVMSLNLGPELLRLASSRVSLGGPISDRRRRRRRNA